MAVCFRRKMLSRASTEIKLGHQQSNASNCHRRYNVFFLFILCTLLHRRIRNSFVPSTGIFCVISLQHSRVVTLRVTIWVASLVITTTVRMVSRSVFSLYFVFTGAVFWLHATVNVRDGGAGRAEKSGSPHRFW